MYFPMILFSLASLASVRSLCLSHAGTAGVCKNIKKCASIIELLETLPPNSVYEKIHSARCGLDGKEITVCCPSSHPRRFHILPSTTTKTTLIPKTTKSKANFSRVPPPRQVYDHPNIRLLEHDLCGPVRAEPRIYGGTASRIFEFPWMVLLAYRRRNGSFESKPRFLCAGTIINNRYVLTAAHCLTNLPDDLHLSFLRIGEYNLATEEDCSNSNHLNSEQLCAPKHLDIGFEELHPHPDYSSSTWQNDIGIVRLNSTLRLDGPSARPICLPWDVSLRRPVERGRAMAAGWGSTGRPNDPPTLQKVELPLLPLRRCLDGYRDQPFVRLWYKQICAGGESGRDACFGDSGGPLFTVAPYRLAGQMRIQQLGLVSFGRSGCAIDGTPGVYTNVVYYVGWILDTMRL